MQKGNQNFYGNLIASFKNTIIILIAIPVPFCVKLNYFSYFSVSLLYKAI